MEDNKTGSYSDKDRSMMDRRSFEADRGKSEKGKKSKAGRGLPGLPGLFEKPAEVDDKAGEARSRIEDLFSGAADKSATDKEPKTAAEALFTPTKPAETEPEKPEANQEPAAEAVETEPADSEAETDKLAGNPENDAEAAETETPLEAMTDDEVSQATKQLAREHAVDAQTEASEAVPGSQAQAEAAAEATLLENIEQTGSIEDGYDKTLEELELEDEAEESAETAEADTAETETEEADEDDPAAVATSTTPAAPVPPSPTSPASLPPAPGGPGRPAGPVGLGGPGGLTGPNVMSMPAMAPNLAPHPVANPNSLNYVANNPNRARRRAADMLVGGIVGYMIGRRRGRLKSEAELLPIQNKLEKQVKQLEADMTAKETRIRRLAAAKAPQPAGFVSNQPPVPAAKAAPLQSWPERSELPEPEAAAEASPSLAVDYRQERGDRAVPPVVTAERAPANPEDVANLNREQLLQIAANIKRDDVSLRTLYETGRLDESGLRQVIQDYWRGERLETSLSRNLKNLETFERPGFDQPSAAASVAKSAVAAGVGLAGQAVVSPYQSSAGSSGHGQAQTPSNLPSPHQSTNQSTQSAQFVGIAIGLVAAVVFLIALALLV